MEIRKLLKKEIISYVQKNPRKTIRQVSLGLEIHYYAIHELIKELEKDGEIRLLPLGNAFEVAVNE